nr:NifB/NifX family molybdenum-iron cluster-binding protein [uncultured Desulfobulbus sp.]
MKVAVTAEKASLESKVFEEFSKAPFLLIVDVEAMEFTPLEHTVSPGSDMALARKVAEYNCEAVLTGKLSETAFEIIADEMITRYLTVGMNVKEAVTAMGRRQLEIIRNPDGTTACTGEHHHDQA